MFKLLFSYPGKDSNIQKVMILYLSIINIRYTFFYLNEAIEDHVDSPSLLTIKDILYDYGVDSVAVRKGSYSYADFETPFICSIQQEDWSQSAFTIVTANEGGHISYLEPASNQITTISLSDFDKMDKEIILLLDAEHKKDELNYKQNKSKEQRESIISRIPIFAFIAVFFTTLVLMFFSSAIFYWSSPFFLISSTIGLLVSLLLVWHEVDAHNPFIKEVCGGKGRKMNCDAVLSSAGATFLGISWAVWGFAYFASFFLSMLLFTQQSSYAYVWAFVSLIVTAYIPYSLYYQSQVVKQWCPLCLSILGVILINAIASISILNFSEFAIDSINPVIHIVTLGLFFLLGMYYAIPLLKQARESKSYAKRWKKLHYNPEIFQALLDKSEKNHVSTDGLGIVVGNPNGHNEIIKVCNPYCGPCSKAHPELEQIIKSNSDVKVRVIFTASGEDDDIRTAPVKHLLAIQEKYGMDKVYQALDDWYLADNKDYDAFAKKYPMNGELKQQRDKIIAMREWCDKMKIRATPTIYINGKELPESYSTNELKNFF